MSPDLLLGRLRALQGVQEASRAITVARSAWRDAGREEDDAVRRFDQGSIRFDELLPFHDATDRAWKAYQAALSAGEAALAVSVASRQPAVRE